MHVPSEIAADLRDGVTELRWIVDVSTLALAAAASALVGSEISTGAPARVRSAPPRA